METEKPIVMLSTAELSDLVREAVRAELGNPQPVESDVLTRDQVAKMFDVHPNVITRYVRAEGLPAYKLGPEWRFRRAEIAKWLDDHAVKPGAHTAKAGKKLLALKGGA